MKKTIFIAACIGFSTMGWAQKQNIQSAKNYLNNDKDYAKALEYINMALNDPSTKDDPKAWATKGDIYMKMQEDPAHKAEMPYQEAAKAYIKATQLKANYDKERIDQNLIGAAYTYYNDAVTAYNQKKYAEAYTYATGMIEIHDLEGGKRFAGNKQFDTLSSHAKELAAFGAYNAEKYDLAMPALQALVNDPLSRTPNSYLLLAEMYKKKGDDAKYLATVETAKQMYPDNQNVRNEELNYYIRTGKMDELIAKLQEAVNKSPENAEYHYNLAKAYYNQAFPKDGKKPANFDELIGKAEASFMSALKLSPESAGYNYETGVLYYNQATDFNSQMNNIKGQSAAENKLYAELEVKRNAMFDKSEPYLVKAYSVLEPKMASTTEDEKFIYQASLRALKEIYARQNKMDKSAEMKKKLDAM